MLTIDGGSTLSTGSSVLLAKLIDILLGAINTYEVCRAVLEFERQLIFYRRVSQSICVNIDECDGIPH